ncbi:MAG: SelB C-terminal domain-containing protein [Armatimonadota bacterium]
MGVVVGVFGPHEAGKSSLVEALLQRPTSQTLLSSQCAYYAWDFDAVRATLVDTPGYERYVHHAYATALVTDVAVVCIGPSDANHPTWREFLEVVIASPATALVVTVRGRLAPLELQNLLASSRFSSAPIIEIERTEEIRAAVVEGIHKVSPKTGGFNWYMAIDGVDTLPRQGYVVTGVIAQGLPQAGSRASVFPGGHPTTMRSVSKTDDVFTLMDAGSRVSMTLLGIDHYKLRPGMLVGSIDEMGSTDFFEAEIDWLHTPGYASEVRITIGTEDVTGRLFPSDQNPKLAQIRPTERIAALVGQPLILRQLHPPLVLGGGVVTTLQATLHRRQETVFEWDAEDPAEAIMRILRDRNEGVMTHEICKQMGVTQQDLGDVFAELKGSRKAMSFGGTWFTPEVFLREAQRFLGCLSEMHVKEPGVAFQPAELVMEQMNRSWDAKCLDLIISQLVALKKIDSEGNSRVRMIDFRIQLTGKQDSFLARVEQELDKHGINAPYISEVAKALVTPTQAVDEIMKLGAYAGRLVEVSDGTYYTLAQLEKIKRKVALWAGDREFNASELRDFLDTSRRFVIPLLEHFDKSGFTIRDEDTRTVAK